MNGKKEKMQAEEGDKDKWDFLSFAETWTPNESLEDPQNELLFTHVRLETLFFPFPFLLKIVTAICFSFLCTSDITNGETSKK